MIALLSFSSTGIWAQEDENPSIEWMSFEEAVELNEAGDERAVFIDVYTDWCGWCKRMDATTFKDTSVVRLMNQHFIAVKLDGEEKDTITFRDHDFVFVPNGRRGYHELAATLLQGKMSYPTFAFLDKNLSIVTLAPGYQAASGFTTILEFIGEGHYSDTSFEDFKAQKEQENSEETVED